MSICVYLYIYMYNVYTNDDNNTNSNSSSNIAKSVEFYSHECPRRQAIARMKDDTTPQHLSLSQRHINGVVSTKTTNIIVLVLEG